MGEQELAEVNSQLILARASAAEAKARLARISDIMKEGIPDESVSDALKNETIISQVTNQAQVKLRELESNAQSYRPSTPRSPPHRASAKRAAGRHRPRG